MADQTPRQVSRLWVKRYARHRTADGTFAPGATLYTRYDGQTRWLRHNFDPIDDDCYRALWASDQARRILTHLLVIAVAALLIGLWW